MWFDIENRLVLASDRISRYGDGYELLWLWYDLILIQQLEMTCKSINLNRD
jgi:hypothetical protein